MIEQLHKAFAHVDYFDDKHIYIDSNTGEQLISVTTFLGRFKTPFKQDYWSYKKATERGITQQEILKEWEDKRIYGTTRGSFIHKVIEDRTQRKTFEYPYPQEIVDIGWEDKFNKEIKILSGQIDNFIKDTKDLIIVKNELIVCNDIIAGQVDLLTNRNIIDIKTDKKIDFHNKYQNFKRPISHLSQCEFNKYSLQISMYRYLLECQGIILPDDDYIVWFNVNNDNYKKIKLNYLKKEVKTLLDAARKIHT